MYNQVFNKMTKVNRGGDLTITNPVQNLYSQRLFDLDSSDTLISMYHLNNYHPLWNIVNINNTNIYRRKENFLNYVGASGSASNTPSTPVITNPCADGNGVEYGFFSWEVEGFNRLRRTTPVRDITRTQLRLSENEPVFDIAGNRVENDFEWDVATLSTSLIQDMHRQVMAGNSSNAGEVAGILELIKFGYIDPKTTNPQTAMDSIVVDWGAAPVCDFTSGNPLAEINGVVVNPNVGANLTIIDLIKAYVKRVAQKISVSSVAGDYQFVSMLDVELLQDIIDCYVCYTVCGRDITRMDSFEARNRNEQLRSQLGEFGAVTLSFDGYNVTFVPWQYTDDLYDVNTDTYSMIFMIPRIGNYPVWEFEFLDMQNGINSVQNSLLDVDEFMVTDSGRFLHMAENDLTCYKRHLETQFRVLHRAPWTSMKVSNISLVSGSLLGRFSFDSGSPDYLGNSTKVASATSAPL